MSEDVYLRIPTGWLSTRDFERLQVVLAKIVRYESLVANDDSLYAHLLLISILEKYRGVLEEILASARVRAEPGQPDSKR